MQVIAHYHIAINMQTFMRLAIFKAFNKDVSITLSAEYVYPAERIGKTTLVWDEPQSMSVLSSGDVAPSRGFTAHTVAPSCR
jgi:hypothetical protein